MQNSRTVRQDISRLEQQFQGHHNRCSKGFDKFQHFFKIKALKKLEIERTYHNIRRLYTTNLQATLYYMGKGEKHFL